MKVIFLVNEQNVCVMYIDQYNIMISGLEYLSAGRVFLFKTRPGIRSYRSSLKHQYVARVGPPTEFQRHPRRQWPWSCQLNSWPDIVWMLPLLSLHGGTQPCFLESKRGAEVSFWATCRPRKSPGSALKSLQILRDVSLWTGFCSGVIKRGTTSLTLWKTEGIMEDCFNGSYRCLPFSSNGWPLRGSSSTLSRFETNCPYLDCWMGKSIVIQCSWTFPQGSSWAPCFEGPWRGLPIVADFVHCHGIASNSMNIINSAAVGYPSHSPIVIVIKTRRPRLILRKRWPHY